MKRQTLWRMLLAAFFLLMLAGSAAQAEIDPANVQKLLAGDGTAFDEFGYAVSISGDTAVIAAYRDDSWKGSVYVFTRTGGVWSQQQKLTANDRAAYDYFGYSVSVSGDTAIIGAWGDDNYKGSAYVFTRMGSVWSQQKKLVAADGAAGDWFGYSVSVSGETALT